MSIEKDFYLAKALSVISNVNEASNTLASDLIGYLEDNIDKDIVFNEEATSGIRFGFSNTIKKALEDENMSFVAIDAIPGFTLTLTKKGSKNDWKHLAHEVRNPFISKLKTSFKEKSSPEYKAATLLLNKFFDRTKKKTIVIETVDILFLLLPSRDFEYQIKEYIKEVEIKDNDVEE
jgi:hypothetical protein